MTHGIGCHHDGDIVSPAAFQYRTAVICPATSLTICTPNSYPPLCVVVGVCVVSSVCEAPPAVPVPDAAIVFVPLV